MSVTESVGAGLRHGMHRRTGEQSSNFEITGGLQFCVAPVTVSKLTGALGKLASQRKLAAKTACYVERWIRIAYVRMQTV